MPDDQAINAVLSQSGFFIHSFGTSELCVAGWLLRVEGTPEAAIEFMTRTRQLAARIARLQSLLRTQGDRDGIAEHLTAIDALRDLRNDVVHGAMAVAEGKMDIALVTWKGTVPISAELLDDATRKLGRANIALTDAYKSRFGQALRLEKAAGAVPPPDDA